MMEYLLLATSLLLSVSAQLLLKYGVTHSSLSGGVWSLMQTIFSPFVFSGFILYGLSAVAWLYVLQRLPLSLAYPTFALTYVLIVFISAVVLHEPVTWPKVLGVVIICLGVSVLYR
jgi:multidrug transporter EmrE-like cation transporter